MSSDSISATFEHDVARLTEILSRSGVELRTRAGELLLALTQMIHRWNKMVNLVSRKDIQRLVSYHFCDSASLLPLIRPSRRLAVLDVGGSNGLPGLVLSTLSPYLEVLICDSKLKRRGFLEDACSGLGTEASYELDRVDTPGFRERHAESFDLIVARAVTKLRSLFKWCLPLLKPGGYVVAYKGSGCLDEVAQAEDYLFRHDGAMLMVVGSPWANVCNPLRMFAIARRRT